MEREAAQVAVLFAFRQDFLAREPRGVVLTEYEHFGATTRVPANPGGIVIRGGSANLNRVIEALRSDYRSYIPGRDRRKSDVLAISGDGKRGELIEVTVFTNAGRAEKQLREKLEALRGRVNYASGIGTHWVGSSWKPTAFLRYSTVAIVSAAGDEIRYLCYEPTTRERNLPDGVILYEVHAVKKSPVRQPQRVPVPVFVPVPAREIIAREFRHWRPSTNDADEWGRKVVQRHPETRTLLQDLALVAGVVATAAAVVLALEPIPGDEVAAFAAAGSLLRYAGVAAAF